MGGGKGRKLVPSTAGNKAPPAKDPVNGPDPSDHLRFRFDMMHPNRWCLWSIQRAHLSVLLKKLAHFELMTVSQARQGGFLVDYDLTDLPNKSAASVWRQHVSDEYDSMSRLAIEKSGPLRLMGARTGGEFHIVFWDPTHEIFPEGKIVR